MQITIEDISPVEKKLAVEIPWDDVKTKLDEAYRELGRGVQLKGFRKGKVPRQMLERLYGKQVEQEVVKELVRESMVKAADEHSLKPVAEPVIDETPITHGQPLKYAAKIEVRPQVTPKDYFGIELTRRAPQATAEQIEHALKHKQDELSQFKKVEGRDTVTERDAVVIKFEGTVGEHKVEHQMMLDLTDQEHEPIPGISAAVVGLPIGAKDREVGWSIAADHPRKELAGREAKLKVTLTDVKEKLVPKLDDDFAKDTGEAQTLEELKQKISDKILASDRQKAERELREQALKELRKRNPLEVSGGLVDRQLDNVVERVKLQLQLAGIDIRNLEESKIREDLREVAADEVRGTLLLEAIAETEKVTVTDADLKKRLAELASLRGSSAEKLRAEYQKEGRLDALKHALREELTLDLLLTRATIKDEAAAEGK
jgi:trigger factor